MFYSIIVSTVRVEEFEICKDTFTVWCGGRAAVAHDTEVLMVVICNRRVGVI